MLAKFTHTALTVFATVLLTVAWLPGESAAQQYRGRQLLAGDPAPDFKLKTVDGTREIQLAAFDKPVVLFFGSFT